MNDNDWFMTFLKASVAAGLTLLWVAVISSLYVTFIRPNIAPIEKCSYEN